MPDFEGCVRQVLRLKREQDKEIYYRHIFGSQVGPGEFHVNGLTASRLIELLRLYGFETKVAYVEWKKRPPVKPHMFYAADVPLPDLTVKAIKVGPPDPIYTASDYTPVALRRIYPNPDLSRPASE